MVFTVPLCTSQRETNSLFHLFSKYLLSINYVPGIVLGAGDTAVREEDKISVFRGLPFQKKMVNKTRNLGGKIDMIMLLRKIRQRKGN